MSSNSGGASVPNPRIRTRRATRKSLAMSALAGIPEHVLPGLDPILHKPLAARPSFNLLLAAAARQAAAEGDIPDYKAGMGSVQLSIAGKTPEILPFSVPLFHFDNVLNPPPRLGGKSKRKPGRKTSLSELDFIKFSSRARKDVKGAWAYYASSHGDTSRVHPHISLTSLLELGRHMEDEKNCRAILSSSTFPSAELYPERHSVQVAAVSRRLIWQALVSSSKNCHVLCPHCINRLLASLHGAGIGTTSEARARTLRPALEVRELSDRLLDEPIHRHAGFDVGHMLRTADLYLPRSTQEVVGIERVYHHAHPEPKFSRTENEVNQETRLQFLTLDDVVARPIGSGLDRDGLYIPMRTPIGHTSRHPWSPRAKPTSLSLDSNTYFYHPSYDFSHLFFKRSSSLTEQQLHDLERRPVLLGPKIRLSWAPSHNRWKFMPSLANESDNFHCSSFAATQLAPAYPVWHHSPFPPSSGFPLVGVSALGLRLLPATSQDIRVSNARRWRLPSLLPHTLQDRDIFPIVTGGKTPIRATLDGDEYGPGLARGYYDYGMEDAQALSFRHEVYRIPEGNASGRRLERVDPTLEDGSPVPRLSTPVDHTKAIITQLSDADRALAVAHKGTCLGCGMRGLEHLPVDHQADRSHCLKGADNPCNSLTFPLLMQPVRRFGSSTNSFRRQPNAPVHHVPTYVVTPISASHLLWLTGAYRPPAISHTNPDRVAKNPTQAQLAELPIPPQQ